MIVLVGCGGAEPVVQPAPPRVETVPVVIAPPPPLPTATEAGSTSTPGRSPRIPQGPASADRSALRRAIRETMKPIAECYERLSPADRRRVVIKFTIGPSGSVLSSTASGAQGELENCIARAFAGTTFEKPADGGTLTVTYPLNFRPG